MDAQTLRRALYDFFKFNPADFIVQASMTGFHIRANKQRVGSSSLLPLQPYNASELDVPKIGVTMGTFGDNSVATPGASVPTIDGTRIDESPAPLLTLSASDVLLYLQVDVDTYGLITAVSVNSTSDPDPPANTPSTLYVRLATVLVTIIPGVSATVTVGTPNLRGSQSYELCAGTTHLYRLT